MFASAFLLWVWCPWALCTENSLIFKKERPKADLTDTGRRKGEVYRPSGGIDPFKAFLVTDEERNRLAVGGALVPLGEADDGGPKTELQRFALSELSLSAVMRKGNQVIAMVQSPDGRGYFVEEGTAIGTQGGVVEEVVSEDRKTPLGVESVRMIIVKEPRLTRDGQVTETRIEIGMPSGGPKD